MNVLILLTALNFFTNPPSGATMLAPGAQEFVASLETVTALVRRADAIGTATVRLHNAWAEQHLTKIGAKPCDSASHVSLAARAAVFVDSYRNMVQSARAEGQRLTQMAAAATVEPLVDAISRDRMGAILGQIEAHERTYMEVLRWHQLHVDPAMAACTLAVTPAGGPAFKGVQLPADNEATAIIGIGGGVICPGAVRADGSVVIIAGSKGCYSTHGCDCIPRSVSPGAVLGPEAP